MKWFVCLVGTFVGTNAAVWDIDLGPEAVFLLSSGPMEFGITGANVNPDTFSTVAGNETSAITYNDSTKTLDIHVGWGNGILPGGESPFDFVNLLGLFTGLSLRGPAEVGENNGLLYSFDPSVSGMVDLGLNSDFESGRFDFSLQLVNDPNGSGFSIEQQETHLLGSKWYLTLDTDLYSHGEARGQLLTQVPEPKHYTAVSAALLLGYSLHKRRLRAKLS